MGSRAGEATESNTMKPLAEENVRGKWTSKRKKQVLLSRPNVSAISDGTKCPLEIKSAAGIGPLYPEAREN